MEIPEPAFALQGYQCDIDGALNRAGQNYEERGRTFLALRGQVMSIVVDEDPAARTTTGLIGVQVHVGPPMKIEYRHILLKELPSVNVEPPNQK